MNRTSIAERYRTLSINSVHEKWEKDKNKENLIIPAFGADDGLFTLSIDHGIINKNS